MDMEEKKLTVDAAEQALPVQELPADIPAEVRQKLAEDLNDEATEDLKQDMREAEKEEANDEEVKANPEMLTKSRLLKLLIKKQYVKLREVTEEEQVTQGKLSLGFRTGGASLTGGEPAAYWMFQTIYGGSTSAKLFLNVREKKSLCYYASAQFVASKGLMIVNSGIENRNFEVARDEILHQLDLCRKGEITDAELESARKTLVNGWRTMLDDPLTLERYWMGQAAAGTLVSPEERIEQVTDITREQVIAAAQSTALDTVFFMKGAAK